MLDNSYNMRMALEILCGGCRLGYQCCSHHPSPDTVETAVSAPTEELCWAQSEVKVSKCQTY